MAKFRQNGKISPNPVTLWLLPTTATTFRLTRFHESNFKARNVFLSVVDVDVVIGVGVGVASNTDSL